MRLFTVQMKQAANGHLDQVEGTGGAVFENLPAPEPSVPANSLLKALPQAQVQPPAHAPQKRAAPTKEVPRASSIQANDGSGQSGTSGRADMAERPSSDKTSARRKNSKNAEELGSDAYVEGGVGVEIEIEELDIDEDGEEEEEEGNNEEQRSGRRVKSRPPQATATKGRRMHHRSKAVFGSADEGSDSDDGSSQRKGKGKKAAADSEEDDSDYGEAPAKSKNKGKGAGKKKAIRSDDEEVPAPPKKSRMARSKAGGRSTKGRAVGTWVVRGVRYWPDRPAFQALAMLPQGRELDIFTLFQLGEMHGLRSADLAEYIVSRPSTRAVSRR